jgi:hypothetical protein
MRRPRRGPAARALARAPGGRLALGVLGLGLAATLNWGYQVARQPADLVGLLSPATAKTPRGTWDAYGSLFRAHATDIVSPTLLAALAQVESGGHPHARPPWRWRWSWNPLEVYAPASSATGLLQMTDGTFRDARRLCVRDGRPARAGAWHDLDGCWFTALATRLVPSHAVETAAAHLHVQVAGVAAAPGVARASRPQQHALAAVIHLCGPARGLAFARRGYRAGPGERCGDHDLRAYLARVQRLERDFARLAPPA